MLNPHQIRVRMQANMSAAWLRLCAVSEQEAIEKLKSSAKGLSAEEAERRLDKYGANELAHAKQLGFWG